MFGIRILGNWFTSAATKMVFALPPLMCATFANAQTSSSDDVNNRLILARAIEVVMEGGNDSV